MVNKVLQALVYVRRTPVAKNTDPRFSLDHSLRVFLSWQQELCLLHFRCSGLSFTYRHIAASVTGLLGVANNIDVTPKCTTYWH